MLRSLVGCLGLVALSSMAVNCNSSPSPYANDTYADEEVSSTGQFATKCQNPNPATPQSNFCDNPACPCTLGEGDCDRHEHCVAPLGCTGQGQYFGRAVNDNVCAAMHCNDRIKNGDETAIDCGGSCGTVNCPADYCATVPVNGAAGHCVKACPCPAGQGACGDENTCRPGLTCGYKIGIKWGYPTPINVCEGPHCTNGVKDGNETGADCGGDCIPCGGSTQFSARYGGALADTPGVVAVDSTGAVIIAGRFSGTINLGGSNLVSAGSSDIFLAKYTSAGAHVFSKRFGSTGADGDAAVALALDPVNNIILAGNIYGSVDFGGGLRTSAGATSSAFLVRMNSAGTHHWSMAFGGAGGNKIESVAANTEFIYVTGAFQNSINLGGSTFTAMNSDPGLWDGFVAKIGRYQVHQWSRQFGSTTDDQGSAIAVDSAGDVYAGGHFSGTVNFGTSLASTGGNDAFIWKLAGANGATTWVRKFGGTGDDRAQTVSVGSNKNPVFGGYFRRDANFGSGTVTANDIDAWVLQANTTNGVTNWYHTFGGASSDFVTSAKVFGTNNDVAITGYYQGSINPGGGTLTSAGSNDVFVVRYFNNGQTVWQRSYGSTGNDRGHGISANNTSGLAITGVFSGTVAFGGAPLNSAGNTDIFVANLKL